MAKIIRMGGKGGAALITAIVFVFFLTLFGLAFYRLGETDIDLFGYDKNLSKALYAAEAGFDKVRWMLWESQLIASANPFESTYVEGNAIAIANPTEGDFFPGVEDSAYFRVAMIQDVSIQDPNETSSAVRVRVLGSVDVDGDGQAGLTVTEGGFTFDPDDVNRRFEAYIGLPGSLSENVSAAARAFSGETGPNPEGRDFVTSDGDTINGFLYFGLPATFGGIWDQWRFIFSNPVIIGDVELPPGIFDAAGEYIDDDNNGIPDYFQDLDLRTYTGTQTFNIDNDPTAGAEGCRVIYVNGDITIDGVDFGHLNDQGDPVDCDWERIKTDRTFGDLAFIANGKITVDRIDCGNVGRLVLVGKDIELVGDYDTKINGIAIAFNDITLNGSGCTSGILTHQTVYSSPVRYAAYFLGSILAGNRINLQDDGWAVIYDENVINGRMYSTVQQKQTLTYERVEAGDFNSFNNWRPNESTPELLHRQGIYTQDEIVGMQGDSGDRGDDGDDVAEVMRVYTDRPRWGPKGPAALGETLTLNFRLGAFQDPDIADVSPQDWSYYDAVTFWMALDNFKRISTDGTKTTQREARYQIRLRDSGGNTVTIPLDGLYPESQWGTVRYHHTGSPEEYTNEIRDLTALEQANGESYSTWKRVRISLNSIDPIIGFDFSSVEQFSIRYSNFTMAWTVNPAKPDARIEWRGSYFEYIDEDGVGLSIEGKDNQGNLNNDPPAPNDGFYYLYDVDPLTGIYTWFTWYEDPDSATQVRMREDVLMPTLRIDRVELPGKPASNDHLEYGFPHCLRLKITNWHEQP